MAKHLLLFIFVFFLSVSQSFAQGSSPLQVVGIDFDNNKGNTPAGWNNTNGRSAGSTIGDLHNQHGQPTGYSMEVTAAFNGSGMGGLSTGDDSGPVPDAVMATFWYRGNGTASLKFALDNTKRYRFRFYGGRDGNNDDKSSDYTIGGATVTLYNWNNVHNEAVIDNVFPDANNEVTVSVKNSPGYTYAILNAITIEEYATDNVPPVLATVPDHTVAVGNVLSIPLSATDPDGDPLTFSVSSAANFIALADNGDGTAAITVSPSTGNIGTHEVTVSVSDGNGGAVTASFILTVLEQGAQVPIQVVGIDFDNNKNNTPGGWNNISSKGAGSKIEDLQNRQGQPTGYSMEVTTAFNGSGMGGLSTGNDSGPVPDAVMATFWYKQNGTASMKFTLDNTRRYRFRFYGGRDGNNDDKSSDYGIGDATVTLYNWNNVNNEAIIDNVTPDVNHEVLVSVSNSPGYAYAILNAITIEEYPGNAPPVIAGVPDQTVTVGNVFSIPLSATDADGDSLSFSVTDGPSFISLEGLGDTTAVLQVSPQAGEEGTYNIEVNVSDGKGGENSTSFRISVTPYEGEVPDSLEYQALYELFEDTNGPTTWWNTDNWLIGETHEDFANWYGVHVENGDVVGLFLMGNYLDGYLGHSLGNLKKLKYLDVSFNELDPYLPNSIVELTSLEVIDLAGVNRTYNSPSEINVFDRLTLIPSLKEIYIYWSSLYFRLTPQIENLINLEVLEAYNCNLGNELPEEIGSLVNLRHLDLSYNGTLYGELPNSIGNLTKLEQLRLGYTSISGEIPSSTGNLWNLNELELGVNNLTGKIPESIGNLVNLNFLNLSHNFFSGSIPFSFTNLANLEYLNLSSNEFSGEILNICQELNKLNDIYINDNKFDEVVPSGLSGINNFNIANNNFKGEIPPNLFATNIYPFYSDGNEFNIANNKINSIPDLSYINDIQHISFFVDISNNQLSFEDIEQSFVGSNQHIFTTFIYQNQVPPAPDTIEVAHSSALTLESNDDAPHNRYQWQREANGAWADIAGVTGADYTISSVTEAGKYRCKITNDWVTGMTLYTRTVHVEVGEQLMPTPPVDMVRNRPVDSAP